MASPPPPPPPSASVKKAQPLPWTHQETVNLIQAYQEKWYSLKRGQLKSSQWEEVAVTVAARCSYDYSHPSKTVIQCRHKMEKLRQRYRAEKQRLAALGATASVWHYFDFMDLLERGPLPNSARPIITLPYHSRHGRDREQQEHDDDDDDGEIFSKSRSINYILKRPTVVNRFPGGKIEGSGSATKRRREAVDEECEVKVEVVEEEEGKKGKDLVLKLAREIRAFGERFAGMENMKMEILRETERCRMEMESKRMAMILKSQKKIVDSIARAFESSNKFNMAHQEF